MKTKTQQFLEKSMRGGTAIEVIRNSYGVRFRALAGHTIRRDTVFAALQSETAGEWMELGCIVCGVRRHFIVHKEQLERFLLARPHVTALRADPFEV